MLEFLVFTFHTSRMKFLHKGFGFCFLYTVRTKKAQKFSIVVLTGFRIFSLKFQNISWTLKGWRTFSKKLSMRKYY